MFNLLRFFTICSLIACFAASVLLGVFYRRSMINDLTDLTEEKNIALGYALVTAVSPQLNPLIQANNSAQTIPSGDVVTALQNAVIAQIRNSQIVKVKVYSLQGRTIFSTETAQIGEDKAHNPGVQSASAGKTRSELAHRETFSVFDHQREDLDVLGTYLPIYQDDAPDKVAAVIEIYSDVTTLIQRIDATQRRVIIALLAAFGTLFGLLWLIVRYASNILQRQYNTVQTGEEALLEQKANLEQIIGERSLALQQSHTQLEHELQERRLTQEQLQRFSDRLQILRELDQAILAANSPENIAAAALHHLHRLVPYARASVVVFDYLAQEGIILAVNGEKSNLLDIGGRVPFASFGILHHADQPWQPAARALQTYATPPTDQPLLVIGITHITQIPLVNQQELIGVLNLGAKDAATLQMEHLDITRDVANLVAIAIHQAHLHEQIQAQASELAQRVAELQQTKATLEEERHSLARRVDQRTVDLQTANRELAKSARLKDEFLAAVSHELRTPLTTILAHSELLQRGVHGPLLEKQERSTDIIQKAGSHLLALINDLLDLSRLQEGKLQLHIEQVDVAEICQTVGELVEPTAAAKQVTLLTIVDPQPHHLSADRRRLLQILTNLLDNAIKFTPAAKRVGLDVVSDAATQQTRFIVWDEGMGIAPEDRTRIFQPFVQLDAGLTRNYSGAGLGLALVQRLVQLHGGDIQVESEVGQGSRFTVVLPWQAVTGLDNGERSVLVPAVVASASDNLPTNGASPSILVAEDNDLNRGFLAEVLTLSGYQPLLAQNGLEALELAKQQPSLILMDVQMPVMNGLQAIRHLRAQGDLTPIIALTGLAMYDDERQCIEAGASGYVSKPFQIDQLLTMIAAHIEARSTNGDSEPV